MTITALPRPRLRLMMWSLAALALLAPLAAMRFTHEVNWGAEDFAAAALLFAGLGLAVELAVAKVRMPAKRLAAIGLAGAVFLAIWAELAVGIFT